jgi:hypothetical protein
MANAVGERSARCARLFRVCIATVYKVSSRAHVRRLTVTRADEYYVAHLAFGQFGELE